MNLILKVTFWFFGSLFAIASIIGFYLLAFYFGFFGVLENAAGMSVRQTVTLKEGISKENSKQINTFIKSLKLKVQSQIQGDQLRVTGKKIDDLQQIINELKKGSFDIHLDYVNFKK